MPTTPTIVAPLPHDPRVIMLAQATGLTRREAFGAAAEAWEWLAAHATDGLVVKAAPDALTALVDVAGFGPAMIAAGLVGVVDDGLVLPAELRRHERDQRVGRGAADAGDRDDSQLRRKALNAESARRYRKRKRMTGSASKSDAPKPRSLGHVAGHEVRVFEGQFGPYAMLMGATLGGERFKKLTTGDKSWTIGTVTLADVLPGLVQKWQAVHDREQKIHDPAKRKILDPPFEALRAAAARHADGADASSRHADASSLASSSSGGGSAYKSASGNGLDAPGASSSRHADGVSSMSSISSLSLSSPEEKREREEREESEIKERARKLRMRQRFKFDDLCSAALDRWYVAQFVAGEHKKVPDLDAVAADLGLTRDEIQVLGSRECWARYRRQILDDVESAPEDMPATIHHEPGEDRGAVEPTTEPTAGDKPATGFVAASGRDEPDGRDHDTLSKVDRLRQSCATLRAAAALGAVATILKVTDTDAGVDALPVALG